MRKFILAAAAAATMTMSFGTSASAVSYTSYCEDTGASWAGGAHPGRCGAGDVSVGGYDVTNFNAGSFGSQQGLIFKGYGDNGDLDSWTFTAAKAFGALAIEQEGFEADDIIATYTDKAEKLGARVTIVTSDKDMMQLISDNVCMLDTMKNRQICEPEVFEKFGVGPDKVIDIQSLAGDSSDNVPGVPGIGVKTAALLINEFGDLDTLLERAGEIPQKGRRQKLLDFAEQARISRELR